MDVKIEKGANSQDFKIWKRAISISWIACGFFLGIYVLIKSKSKEGTSEVLASDMLSPISLVDPAELCQKAIPTITHPRAVTTVEAKAAARPIPTNKFFGNLLLPREDQSWKIWAHPYVLQIGDGTSPSSPAISISHSTEHILGPPISSQKASQTLGEENKRRVKSYTHQQNLDFGLGARRVLPQDTGIQDLNLSMVVESWDQAGTAVRLKLYDSDYDDGYLTVPVVRGMAYVTLHYHNLTPVLCSEHQIVSVNGQLPSDATEVGGSRSVTVSGTKFRIELNNGDTWLSYALDSELTLQLSSNGKMLLGSAPYSGIVRATKLPSSNTIGQSEAEMLLDQHSVTYPTGSSLSASMSGSNGGFYSFQWETDGNGASPLLHYAFPHHQSTLQEQGAVLTGLTMQSTTKGVMRAYVGNEWKMEEPDLIEPLFLPPVDLENLANLAKIKAVLVEELAEELPVEDQQEWSWSNYFMGKVLLKQAQLCLISHHLGLIQESVKCLSMLKKSFSIFISNAQSNPLVYDLTYKGLIGQGGLTEGNEYYDFGSSYYNDHHYHYGYFLHAAAIIAHLDKAWLSKDVVGFVDVLARDVANPSEEDPHFPVFRSFDWFAGHSWSQGVFGSDDGKDQESTSEEMNFHVGLALWGVPTERTHLKNLGRLMATVASRSIQTYFLLDSSNAVHPKEIVRNKVTGVYFENKVDYTTWFGDNEEYIHGIQVLPVIPVTGSFRSANFVSEEWAMLGSLPSTLEDSPWQSLLYMSYAIVNHQEACQKLETTTLDSGLSRTWALFWCSSRSVPKAQTTSVDSPEQMLAVERHRDLQGDGFCLPENAPDMQACMALLSLAQKLSGLGIFYDGTCADVADVGCRQDSMCRLCASTESEKAAYVVCPFCNTNAITDSQGSNDTQAALPYDFHTGPCSLPEPLSGIGDLCVNQLTLQDRLAGLGMYYDPICSSSGGVGCSSNSCRLCAISGSNFDKFLACPPCVEAHYQSLRTPVVSQSTAAEASVLIKEDFPTSVSPTVSNEMATTAVDGRGWCNLPEAGSEGPCTVRLSLQEAMEGLGIYYDESCISNGGVGCHHKGDSCRLCAIHESQKNVFVACPSCVSLQITPSHEEEEEFDPLLPYTFGEESCTFQTMLGGSCQDEVTLGQLAQGLGMYYDQSCTTVGGVGCIKQDHLIGCRLCAQSKSQQTKYLTCPPCVTDDSIPHPKAISTSTEAVLIQDAALTSENDDGASFKYDSKDDILIGIGCGLVIAIVLTVFGALLIQRKRSSQGVV